MSKDCSFCRDYTFLRKIRKKSNDKANADPECDYELKDIYKVSIVSQTKRRLKGHNSKFVRAGISTHGTYPLRYCPVCGRKL